MPGLSIQAKKCRPPTASTLLLGNLGLKAFPQFLLPLSHLLVPANLALDALPRAQDLALQVEAAALLGIVEVEQALEALGDELEVDLAHLGGADVEDLAGLVHGDVGRGKGAAAVLLVGGGVLLRGGGLLVGFGDGAAYYSGAGEDDLGYYAMGLQALVWDGVKTQTDRTIVAETEARRGCE